MSRKGDFRDRTTRKNRGDDADVDRESITRLHQLLTELREERSRPEEEFTRIDKALYSFSIGEMDPENFRKFVTKRLDAPEREEFLRKGSLQKVVARILHHIENPKITGERTRSVLRGYERIFDQLIEEVPEGVNIKRTPVKANVYTQIHAPNKQGFTLLLDIISHGDLKTVTEMDKILHKYAILSQPGEYRRQWRSFNKQSDINPMQQSLRYFNPRVAAFVFNHVQAAYADNHEGFCEAVAKLKDVDFEGQWLRHPERPERLVRLYGIPDEVFAAEDVATKTGLLAKAAHDFVDKAIQAAKAGIPLEIPQPGYVMRAPTPASGRLR